MIRSIELSELSTLMLVIKINYILKYLDLAYVIDTPFKSFVVEDNVLNALVLLLVGMSTVMLILFIIVSGGNLLIRLVNRIKLDIHEVPFTSLRSETVSTKNEAAIIEAVRTLTKGRGKVEYIKKK
ncbi:MAG: hypothetical protein WBP08_09825 [Saprospiraceae bacterium]